ncbi:SCO family protein [Actinomarinicola tropica]|uniref:Twin-arginine translocation signal domain-containing protein n=1 Tax=Actinomarinicola tropica TaxID=2789776 RepID=A0A5Q2RK83_9ACTN|nr:SCO family protein [Actinomarinicola tropica]QGG96243.1 twin-arginine translocation signal domain-containing protein [Actinomarinicola tropica]
MVELPWTRRRFLGLMGGASAAAVLAGCGSNPSSPAATPPEEWGGVLVDPPLDKPDVTLQTTDGQPFPFRDATSGKLTMLFFGFTNCPDVCPIWLNTVARALEEIGSGPGSDPQVLFVGVDVARDTPEVLDTYLDRFDPTFIGLTGTETAIAAANDALYFPSIVIGAPDEAGAYEVGHYARAAVFSPDNTAHRLYGYDVSVEELVHDLPLLAEGTFR